MALELIREEVAVSRIMSRNTLRTVIENDVIVPDYKADVAGIVLTDAEVFLQKADPSKDKINVKGVLRYNVIYTEDSERQLADSITGDIEFSEELSAAGCTQDMRVRLKCSVEHIDCRILNGRKLNVKAVTAFSYDIMRQQALDVISDIEGLDDLQVKRQGVDINIFKGSVSDSFVIKEMLEVPGGKPSIANVLSNDLRFSDIEYRLVDNKLIIKGNVHVSSMYVSEDEEMPVQYMEHEVPFSQFVDIPGADEDSQCDAFIRVKDASFAIGENADNEKKVIEAYLDIEVNAQAHSQRTMDVVSDVYSPTRQVSIKTGSIVHDSGVRKASRQLPLRENFLLGQEEAEIHEIISVKAVPVISDCIASEGKITVEGLVRCSAVYSGGSDSGAVSGNVKEIGFKQVFDMDGVAAGQLCEAAADIEYITYNLMSANEMELRVSLDITASAGLTDAIPVIEYAEARNEPDAAASPYSVILYFARQDDSLWSIAKKYRTTTKEIEAANDLEPDSVIKEGQQILIPLKRRNAG